MATKDIEAGRPRTVAHRHSGCHQRRRGGDLAVGNAQQDRIWAGGEDATGERPVDGDAGVTQRSGERVTQPAVPEDGHPAGRQLQRVGRR